MEEDSGRLLRQDEDLLRIAPAVIAQTPALCPRSSVDPDAHHSRNDPHEPVTFSIIFAIVFALHPGDSLTLNDGCWNRYRVEVAHVTSQAD